MPELLNADAIHHDDMAMDPEIGVADLIERAACLVNPASGIANDFLNHFNEILLLVENLPVLLPEMVDELMQWRPTTYRTYLERSPLPGTAAALAAYEGIDVDLRDHFDALVERLNAQALEITTEIASHRDPSGSIDAESIAEFCAKASLELRGALEVAANLVNSGRTAVSESAQSQADRPLAR